MARVTYSPLVSDVSGSVGDTTFSKWKGQSYIREKVTPSNPKTAAQTAQRDAMKETVALWQSLSDATTGLYDAGVSGQPKSGYNSFVERNVTAIKNDAALTGPKRPPGTDPTLLPTPDDVSAATGTGSGEVDITWTDPGGDAEQYLGVIVYDETADVLVEDVEEAALLSDGSYTVTGITPGNDVTIASFTYDSGLESARDAGGATASAGE